ncbi:hypothetical protein BDA96_03G037300 [Sorghum bicolor]|jgi:hypothetical protein|uniref:Secreted protein n=1 Tax=Sorghum bicolor TaxID=4558 RepID=A0A921RAE1_SORBI|nr:hypothetical protein BDA96_03G037300 [Sorghum bicolor]
MPLLLPCLGFPFFHVWSGHSFAGCKGGQNHHQEEACIVDRGQPLEQTTLVAKRYSLMDVASNQIII